LSGGEGTDFAYIYRQNSTQNLSLDLSLDPSVVQALGDGTQVSGIERVEFYGGSGNDSITGGALNDTIDGGDGSDTVIFAGSRKNYDIAVEGSQLRVTDSQSGASDLLTNIEAYIFDGQRYDATYLLTNHIPFVANPIPDQTAIEDTAFSFVVPDNAFDDPDTGGRLIYSAQLVDSSGNPAGTGALPSWLQFDAATRTFTGTPPSNFNGSLTLRVSASDGTLSAMSDFVLTVNAVNDLPTVSQPVTVAIDEDASPFSTSLLQGAFDVDADALMVQNLMLVEGNAAGITPSEQNLLVDPGAYAYLAAGESAVLRYTYAISDGHDGSIDQSATITVEGRNDAPVLQSGSPLFVSEAENVTNQPLSAPITASGSLSFTDADLSDTHLTATTFVAAVLPSGGTVPSAVEDALRGALAARVETDSTGSGAGTLAWTFSLSDALGSFLAAGQTLVVTYDVTIDDQHTGGTSTQPVAITITGANDVPVISASVDTGTKSFGEFTQGQSGLSTAGTLNVADPDLADRVAITRQDVATTGDAGGLTREQLLAMLTVGPTALAADPGSTGNLGWSFDSGGTSFAYLGAGDTLDLLYTIRATDDSGGIGDGTVAIRILGTNDAPVAAQPLSGQSVNEDTAWLYTVPADTFTDVDGDTLALSATLADGTALPTWLRFDATSRTFSGTPPSNFNGSLALRVTASDGTLSATSDFTLAVNAVNDAPVVARALVGQSVNEDTAWSYTVPAGTFTDVDGNALTLSATLASGSDLPAWVSFDAATGRFSGTPPLNFNGSLALRVTASDGTLSAASDFTLTVNPVNDAPVVSREIPDQYVRQGTAFTYQVPAGTFTDVDSSALTLSATRTGGGTLPSWLTFNAATGTFSGTPTGSEDLVAVTVRASDGSLSATDTFELRIGRSLSGGNSADSLVGGIGNDTIRGGNGDDLLRGGSGRDLLFGDNGADRLEGGADNDVLTGGSGDDLLIGGTGRDLYVFGKANGADRIQNGFTLGEDFLQLIEGVTIRSVTNAGGNTVVQLASGSVASGTVTIEGLTGATAATLLVSNGTLGTDGALT
jgi:VCBS repeat-containing protein